MTDKLSILCVSGVHERIQMAAMAAATAAAGGTEVTVFFSMNALSYFVRGASAQAPAEGDFGRHMAGKNVPSFKRLFEQAKELGGARLYACSMALDVLGVDASGLEEYLDGPLGLTRFLSDGAEGQIVVF